MFQSKITPTSVLCAAAIFCPALPAESNLIHRYSFSETSGTSVADSVGGADGVVRGSGAAWGGGQLVLPGGSSSSAAYVDLPNGLISGLTDLSVEVWTTNNGAQNWARIFDFGSTEGGELSGPGGGGAGLDYLFLSASRGSNNNLQRLEIRNEDPGGGGIDTIDTGLTSTNGVQYHHVVTFDADGAGGQARMTYYRDAVLVSQVDTSIQLNEINDVNNWLGRSNWTGDSNYEGSFDEFRIYDSVLDQAAIESSKTVGPNLPPGGPTINSFAPTPATIYEGDSATLAWDVTDVTGTLDISVAPSPGSIPGDPAAGSAVVSPLVTTTYTLSATDEVGNQTAEALVVVDPGVPVADNQSVVAEEEVSANVTLVANDPNGGTLVYSIVTQPVGGVLTGTPPEVTYTPAAGFLGADSFTFQANDGKYDSNIATVSITVNTVPAAPTDITLSSLEIPSIAGPGTILADMDADDDNSEDTHAFALVAGTGDADNGLFSISGDDLLAQNDFSGQTGNNFNIRLRVTDSTGRSFEKAFVLTVVEASGQVVINEMHYDPEDNSLPGEFIELHNPSSATIDLSGWLFDNGIAFTFPAGTVMAPGSYLVIAQDPATVSAEYGAAALGPWTGKLDGDGEQVTLRDSSGQVIDEVDYKVGFPWPIASSGDGGSMELLHPHLDNDLGSSWRASSGAPTPGAQNSVFSTAVPPNIRQVDHAPQSPNDSQPVTITAKVTDPQGVGSVNLLYQVVAPGQFIPARTPRTVSQILADPNGDPPLNPDFEDPANWTTAAMVDDGSSGDVLANDGIYSVVLPAQAHRTLVRYRIEVEDLVGASVRVPYPDDRSLNFAYFVYNGVPDYVASTASVHPDGAGRVWPKEMLTSVPVYHWLIRPQDMLTLQAYNSSEQFTNNGSDAELAARRAWDWEGAMVYDGIVYDHIRARLRGGNSRYGDFDGRFPRGKRHYKFRFNKGHYFAARDEMGRPYERKWRIFNVSRMFGTKGGNSWGLPEEIGDRLYHTMGVPTQRAHWFHFRVVDDAQEAPDQYHGDFWGLMQVQERYDVRFLESRNMTKGNLYKLSDFMFDAERQRRYQALGMVSDGSEFDNIRNNLHGSQSAAWLNEHVNYERWYGYSAVGEAIRHYDIFPEPSGRHRLKNLVWYFEPVGSNPARGVCWHLPYDYDASWGPSFNNGWDHANNGLYGWVNINGQPYIDKPDMKIAHRNVLRSFRDLVWQPDQIEGLLDDRAAVIAELSQADQDRWRDAPTSAGTANDDPLTFKLQDMKNFAFTGWSGGSGPSVSGGRDAFLDAISDGPDSGFLPETPAIRYRGAAGYPTDGLHFQSGLFSDPQGTETFAAMEWRIGEIEDPSAPAWDVADDFILENDLIWGSGELTSFESTLAVPGSALKVGHTYRARVRHKDTSGRWSHWSSPIEFTTGLPLVLGELQSNLMITEIMYHPGAPSAAEVSAGFSESDFEYVELRNISQTLTLDLSDVRFTKGVDFDFSSGTVTSLAPGEFVLVVRNTAAFEMRYGTGLPLAGEWESGQNLSNGGERIKLSHGSGTAIHDFDYDDNIPWPTEPDGSGVSLVLDDPFSAPDHGIAANWRAGVVAGGTPGNAEPLSPFAQWLADEGLSDPLGDPNGIGLSNLLVFALGADLLASPWDAVPEVRVVTEGVSRFFEIQFRRRLIASDLDYLVEVSGNLSDWELSGTAIVSNVDNGDGTETVTVRSLAPVADNERLFMRLRVQVR